MKMPWQGQGSTSTTDTTGTMGKTRDFYPNREHRKSRQQLTTEIREVNSETRKRNNNSLTTEDQGARLRNLRDARSRQN